MKLYDQRTKTSSFILMVSPSPFIIPNCLAKSLHHLRLSHQVPPSFQTVLPLHVHKPKLLPLHLHHPKLSHHIHSLSQTVLPLHLHHPKLSYHCTFVIPNCLTIAPPSSQTVLPLYLHYPKLSHHCTTIIPNCLTIVPSSSRPVSTSPFIIPNCFTKLLHHPKLSHHCTFIITCSQQVSFFPNPFSFCSKLSHRVLDR